MAVKADNTGTPASPDGLIGLLQDLKRFYDGFTWESALWRRVSSRRSPYRTLVLFGLSARTQGRAAGGDVPGFLSQISRCVIRWLAPGQPADP